MRAGLRLRVTGPLATAIPARSACTSSLVERRDPLGAGLRHGRSTVRTLHGGARQTAVRPIGCPAVMKKLTWYRAAI